MKGNNKKYEYKRSFLDHSMSCSALIPGPGAYSPR